MIQLSSQPAVARQPTGTLRFDFLGGMHGSHGTETLTHTAHQAVVGRRDD